MNCIFIAQNAAPNDSYSEAYSTKILRNLQVHIRNIHISFIDEKLGACFGVYLNSLILNTADSAWNQVLSTSDHALSHNGAVYKVIRMEQLGVVSFYTRRL